MIFDGGGFSNVLNGAMGKSDLAHRSREREEGSPLPLS